MPFQINGGSCIGCGACQEVCPVKCIKEMSGIRYILEDQCISCQSCYNMCPVKCIVKVP